MTPLAAQGTLEMCALLLRLSVQLQGSCGVTPGRFGSCSSEQGHIPLGQLPPYVTHTTSLSWICCFCNENTLLAFPSLGLVIIPKHLSARQPSFPESLDLITPGNVLLFPSDTEKCWFLSPSTTKFNFVLISRGGKKRSQISRGKCSDHSQRCPGFTLHH